ncbi:hepatocyte cell adhesion molecule-like [Acipenser oxyrinchus oxyrinchus]|uniref:Hepatocyte cell adhesion molecule-like n=1 Tax=Acipenser oxyrinchus oxyrinchus TaxID=40147 RepID=A0AAD8FW41_ACIOX|nr:hepatocyte cell adhesion molecule-like [Acipenser oxyrinchus oxyrinchus]
MLALSVIAGNASYICESLDAMVSLSSCLISSRCRLTQMCRYSYKHWHYIFIFITIVPVSTGTLEIKVEHATLYGAVGESVLLSVNYSLPKDAQLLDITWKLKQGPGTRKVYDFPNKTLSSPFITNYEKRAEDFRNGSIMLKDLMPSDEGLYVITITTSDGIEKDREIQLYIEAPVTMPSITQSPQSASRGELVSLLCNASRTANMTMRWLESNSSSPENSFSDENVMLLTLTVAPGDCRTYTCVVENNVSRKQLSHTLNGSEELCGSDILPDRSSLWISLGILIPIALCIIIIIIMGCCYKTKREDRKKGKDEAELQEMNPDLSKRDSRFCSSI